MARKRRIVWTEYALYELKNICEYWDNRNKSKVYSNRLRKLAREELHEISQYPFAGSASDITNVRFKVIENYLLFYTVTEESIIITAFWNARQNPDKLPTRLG